MPSIEPLAAADFTLSPSRRPAHVLRAWAFLAAVVITALWPALAAAQCPDWIPTFGGEPGASSSIKAMAVFDDGSGPALYAGGLFTSVAGGPASRVARWNGSAWSPVGSGVSSYVYALTVFDDGTGPALYAGGYFTAAGGEPANRIAKWDGTTWSPVGSGFNNAVYALAVFDDGTGPALYAGGLFTATGEAPANHIAKWNGTTWSAVGSGMSGSTSSTGVRALTVYNSGTGAALYAGGRFESAGEVAANNIARWDGTSWSAMGVGLGGRFDEVKTLAVLDGGAAAWLYAGGNFGSSNIAVWNGSAWSGVGGGFDNNVHTLIAFDDGTGRALYAGGFFNSAGGQPASRIARWNGLAWSRFGTGLDSYYSVDAFAVYDDGTGPALYAGGLFDSVNGTAATNIARWNGAAWAPVSGRGLNSSVNAITTFDDGAGAALYAGGSFNSAGGVPAHGIVKWHADTWTPLGGGLQSSQYGLEVNALTTFDDGGGVDLYAAGRFTAAGGISARGIARWDGATWTSLGSGLGTSQGAGTAYALAVFDDGAGPDLYVGGYFITAGAAAANHIASWNGTSWSPLGSGLDSVAQALAVFDDGTGPALYVGGSFDTAGGAPANGIAKWDGVTWSALGSGVDGGVQALAVYNDGTGPGLYAAGWFSMAGGTPASYVARWDGAAWSALGEGIGPCKCDVRTLAAFDDGAGPALYAGGSFIWAGGIPARGIAKWDGLTWSPLASGAGLDGVNAFAVFDDGTGPALCIGGDFQTSPGGDSYLARYGCLNQSTCRAELTGAVPVDVFDLLAYLNLWFASSPDAERTGDSPAAIDVFDLLTYLDAWFPESAAGCG